MAIVVLLVTRPWSPTDDGAVRIGAILPLTGDNAAWGEQARDGIALAVDQFNGNWEEGEVSVDYQDTRADPTEAVSAANYLIRTQGVPAIIGDMTSATTLAAAPVCERNHVVLLSPVASSPLITDAGEYIYRIWPPDIFEAGFSARWLMEKGYDTIGIVYLNDEFGVPLKDTFRSQYEALGGVVLLEEGYTTELGDLRPIVLRVREANPDAVYLASHYADAAQLARRFVEQGVDALLVGTNDLMNDEFIRQAGSAAEGIHFPNREAFNPEEEREDVQRFVSDFSERYERTPGLVEAQAYDAARLVLSAIEQGARTGEEIKGKLDMWMEQSFPGVTGLIVFDEKGDIRSAAFEMMRSENEIIIPAN